VKDFDLVISQAPDQDVVDVALDLEGVVVVAGISTRITNSSLAAGEIDSV
jgi:hypothetical protein